MQDTDCIRRRRLGGGLHGIQSAAASHVLLLLDDGGGQGRAGRHLVDIRVAASPRRHPRRLLSLPTWRGYVRVNDGWRSRRHWRRCTTQWLLSLPACRGYACVDSGWRSRRQ